MRLLRCRFRALEYSTQQLGGGSVGFLLEMGIDGQRRATAGGVAESAGDGAEVDAGTEERGSHEMAKVVKADAVQPEPVA